MMKRIWTRIGRRDRKALGFSLVSNSAYCALMGSVIVPLAVNWTVLEFLGYGLFKKSAPMNLRITVFLSVELLAVLLFSVYTLYLLCTFKIWLMALPLQYLVGIGVMSLATLLFNYSFDIYGIYADQVPYILLRPLALLALQTAILGVRTKIIGRRKARNSADRTD